MSTRSAARICPEAHEPIIARVICSTAIGILTVASRYNFMAANRSLRGQRRKSSSPTHDGEALAIAKA